MKVKCQICGNEIEKQDAFAIKKDDKTFYYCSEKEYLQKQKIIKQRVEIVGVYAYCIGVDDGSAFSLIQREFNLNLKSLVIEKVYYFVIKNKAKLKRTIDAKQKELGKEFTIYNKIKYITAIIKNQLDKEDYSPPVSTDVSIQLEGDIDINIYEPKNKYISKRRALSELEDLYGEDE